MSRVIFFLGDCHVPYHSKKAIIQVSDAIKEAQDNGDQVTVVQVGDLADQRAWSRFPKDGDVDNAQREFDDTVTSLEWLHGLIPNMHIIFGNHDRRIAMRASDSQIPRQLIRSLDEVFDFPSWKWHVSDTPLIIDGIAIVHGDEFPIPTPSAACLRLARSVVYGHSHQGRLEHVRLFDRSMFAMNVGWLGDESQSAFNYAKRSPARYWLGYGVVVDNVPMLVPLEK